MKNLLLLTIFVGLFLNSSCSSNDDDLSSTDSVAPSFNTNYAEYIIGKWRLENTTSHTGKTNRCDKKSRLKFTANKFISTRIFKLNKNECSSGIPFKTSYTIEGNKIIRVMKRGGLPVTPNSTISYEVFEDKIIETNIFTFEGKPDVVQVTVYRKIKE